MKNTQLIFLLFFYLLSCNNAKVTYFPKESLVELPDQVLILKQIYYDLDLINEEIIFSL